MARMTRARRAEQLMKRLGDPKDLNYDVPAEIIKMLKHSRVKTAVKVDLLKTLLQYTHPKQKAIELDQGQQQPVTFNFDLGAGTKSVLDEESSDG